MNLWKPLLTAAVLMLLAATPPCFSEALSIVAAVPPQAGIVERIAGSLVNIQVLVRPDQDPHTYEPTPRQMNAISGAKIFFTAHMPFEEALMKKLRTAMPTLAAADPAEGIAFRAMEHPEDGGHDAHGHGEEALDPHIWLAPAPLAIQAKNIAAALRMADPAHGETYDRGLAAFLQQLNEADTRIRARLEPYRGRSFLVFHPAFGYFADAYGLKQEPVEMEGKSPTPRQIQQFIQQARDAGSKVIFVQPQYDPKSGEAIAAAIGGHTMTLNSLERDPLKNLEEIAARLEAAFKESSKS